MQCKMEDKLEHDIVSELIGKRTLMIYLNLRIDVLKQELLKIKKYPQKDRENIKSLLKGRLREVKELRKYVHNGHSAIKKQAKHLWKVRELIRISGLTTPGEEVIIDQIHKDLQGEKELS